MLTSMMTDLANERHQMVFAQAVNLDILHDYQLIMIFLEDRVVNDVSKVLFITLREEHHRLRVTLRGSMQALSLGILANAFQNRTNSTRQLFQACRGLLGVLALTQTLQCTGTWP